MTEQSAASPTAIYDAVIIGAGPAGLTCAIFLGRYNLRVLVVDSGKTRNYASQGVHGWLGSHGIKPGELLARGREEAVSFGVEICQCVASKIEKVGDFFEVTTNTGVSRARRIVLAYGVRDHLPDLPDFEQYYGKAIHHCPDCDGYEITGKRVGVFGWGKRVAGFSLKLRQWTDRLTIFTNGQPHDISPEEMSKLQAETIRIVREKIVKLVGDGEHLRSVVTETGEEIEVEAIFFSIGTERSCTLAEEIGCDVEETTPNVKVDAHRQTSVEGVYAVGDLVAGSQLAITSAADGAIAAIALNKTLQPPIRQV